MVTRGCAHESGCSAEAGKPAVSVIIPAYNAAPFIGQTLESVFAQTLKDFEVILINDGSPDTEELERVLQPYMDRIIYLTQENLGPSAARNRGIRRARGEYVAFLDSDDAWFPEYLAEQVMLLKASPSLDMIYSDNVHVSESFQVLHRFMETCPSKGPVTFENLLLGNCHVPTGTTVARCQAVVDAGLFDENFRRAEDYDLWLRMAHGGAKIAYHPKVLGRGLRRSEGLSASSLLMLEALVQVLAKLDGVLPLSPRARALLQSQMSRTNALIELERGKQHLASGKYKEASAALRKANESLPTIKIRAVLFGLKLMPSLTGWTVRTWSHWSLRWRTLRGSARSAVQESERPTSKPNVNDAS